MNPASIIKIKIHIFTAKAGIISHPVHEAPTAVIVFH